MFQQVSLNDHVGWELVITKKGRRFCRINFHKTLAIAPWWPQGHFNRAIITGELKKYSDAIRDMKLYVRLAPNAPDARAAQDKIYQWEMEPQEFSDCPECPTMVALPDKGYAIGKYDVTFDEWDACVAAGGCNGYSPNDGTVTTGTFSNDLARWGRGTRPVINVNWDNAESYIQWLSHKTGKQYRLPTEAEWQYACYGGTKSEYCGGNDIDAVAWYDGNSGTKTHPVGQKQANEYGLYDMSGNVWEWTSDCWEGDCANRVLRGGSWFLNPQDVRAVVRGRGDAAGRNGGVGFRLAETLAPVAPGTQIQPGTKETRQTPAGGE